MDEEQYQGLKQFRQFLHTNPFADPYACPYITPDTAAEWVIARQKPLKKASDAYEELSLEESRQIDIKYGSLQNIVKPLFKEFFQQTTAPKYKLYLSDPNGIPIIATGLSYFYSNERIDRRVKVDYSRIGGSATLLTLKKKRPVQTLGVEHYSSFFSNLVDSSAPIFNDDGSVAAVLSLVQFMDEREQLQESKNKYTLAFVSALAMAIQSQMQLKQKCFQLGLMHNRMEKLLNMVDGIILTINKDGTITEANNSGLQTFDLNIQELHKHNIKKFLRPNSTLMKKVQEGSPASIEEMVLIDQQEKSYMVYIRPEEQDNGDITSTLLHLTPIERLNELISNRVGSIAMYRFKDIIGMSEAQKTAISLSEQFSQSQENILLIGESGTGKELFAQAIHNASRPQGPFISVNCAAIPRELIESELFGYEPGSFTGADRKGRIGKIELAHNGTLFLDEIGDMPYELQSVLLRVLQDKQITRIGSRKSKKVEFRLIAATNKDLEYAIIQKNFRSDLYFRLSVLTIKLPPLRERKEDIEVLSRYFIKKYCQKINKPELSIHQDALMMLDNYHWPGNVRQLENTIIYAVNAAKNNVIMPEELPPGFSTSKRISDNSKNLNKEFVPTLKEWEVAAINAALKESNYSVSRAANKLGIHRATLYRRMKAAGILPPQKEKE